MRDTFPLNQWFDLSRPISRDERRTCEAEMALRAFKEGLTPDGPEWRRDVECLRRAVKQHNLRLQQRPTVNEEFWREMQPLVLVDSREAVTAAIPAILDVVLHHSDGPEPDDDLLRDAISELSVLFDSFDPEELDPDLTEDERAVAFAIACEKAFDEAMDLMRAEIERRRISGAT
jgi:hypothetical protein